MSAGQMKDGEATEALRRMVREVLQEVLPHEDHGRAAVPVPASVPPGDDVRRVRVRDDHDLTDLVTQVLNLAEDPDRAADVRTGRIRFTLADESGTGAPSGPAPIDIDRGAVTERLIQRAAREQRPLRLGPRAVVTPLARDRARALGVALDRTSTSATSSTQGRETR
jgi:hypothetical protein